MTSGDESHSPAAYLSQVEELPTSTDEPEEITIEDKINSIERRICSHKP
ncbi:7522_t:CDS:2 [Acaulospora morrowiae]|uniref:7522_t:CDS:1 n=1 Tax=Acaulospora morrowiae TaxID=94023 RepID=A0A9N9FH16_9GLOM|nr:7522_t:CDS:2 [Acaulospora morrowiae]